MSNKGLFTRIANFVGDSFLLYNDNKILYNGDIYKRIDNKWKVTQEEKPYEVIGFVPFEIYSNEVAALKEEIESLKKKKSGNKYRSMKNFDKQASRIKTVMKFVGYINSLCGNFEEIDNRIKSTVLWDQNKESREKELAILYKEAMSKDRTKNKKKIYSIYRKLSLWRSMYEEKLGKVPDDNYSNFYMELKSASSKSNSEVTKFCVKIDLFTKFFDLLPRGSYAVCDIPLTYWLLIYREFWDMIIDCISNGRSFPYDKISEIRTVSMLEGLDLNKLSDENEEEVVDEDEEFDEEIEL